ncbi:purine nucleoside phosphorylase I, inosine and guanosine-specific [Marinitoga piezophila KA3]|uniref:Purine nucleoside phosphorylase n=1 Tax=Marinitoga piezophila (strain DSM 14283 / JCM 11233 / KA3) TaxID=443254 RepID=H2J802_MARPK|nr:purine-nucleoside phosphorylase [Marinitoga piezophila]AEX85493.1 purine nucleoside phosphorylase I, inosine and guanosine-specific [Marinitoga piezophila KA3]
MNFDIEAYVKNVKEAAEYIKSKVSEKTEVAIVLGSGLHGIANKLEDALEISYSEIPNFPVSTAPGHKGSLMFGKISGKNVMLMNGRFHYYEGYTMKEVTFPIRVMQELGIKILIVTNAAGGMNPNFEVGNPCIITDQINFFGDNPLIGPNYDEWGPRFPDMSEAYDKELTEKAISVAKKLGIPVYTGVYLGITGPTFETPAELKMMRNFGADLVGMSTVPEVIVANHAGIRVLGFSAVTDKAVPDELKPVTAEEVIEIANKTGEKIANIILELLGEL